MVCRLCSWIDKPTDGQMLALCYATPEVITVGLDGRACSYFVLRGE